MGTASSNNAALASEGSPTRPGLPLSAQPVTGSTEERSSEADDDRGGTIDQLLGLQAAAYVHYHPEAAEELFGAAAAAQLRGPLRLPSAQQLSRTLRNFTTPPPGRGSAAAASTSYSRPPQADGSTPRPTPVYAAEAWGEAPDEEAAALHREQYEVALDDWLARAIINNLGWPPLGPDAPRATLRASARWRLPGTFPGVRGRQRDGSVCSLALAAEDMTWELPSQ